MDGIFADAMLRLCRGFRVVRTLHCIDGLLATRWIGLMFWHSVVSMILTVDR